MADLDSQRNPPSAEEAWWYELSVVYSEAFTTYLVAHVLGPPVAVIYLFDSGHVATAAGLGALWLVSATTLARDFLRKAVSRLSWAFLWVWLAIAAGWGAYALLVV